MHECVRVCVLKPNRVLQEEKRLTMSSVARDEALSKVAVRVQSDIVIIKIRRGACFLIPWLDPHKGLAP